MKIAQCRVNTAQQLIVVYNNSRNEDDKFKGNCLLFDFTSSHLQGISLFVFFFIVFFLEDMNKIWIN